MRRNAAPIAALCQQLPHLTSIELSERLLGCWNAPLGDEELLAVAALPRLTALTARVDITTAGGWAALTSMRALWSLRLTISCTAPLLDLRSMGALTELVLDYERWKAPDSTLQVHLPDTLVALRLNHLIDGVLPPLPHLTSLALTAETAGQPLLALLAVQCPRLASLDVDQLALSDKCYATLLPAVTQLQALGGAIDDADGVEYRHVFPALQALS